MTDTLLYDRPKKRSDNVTHSIRLPPDLSAELSKYPHGDASRVVQKALRKFWKMPAPREGL